MIYVIFQGYNFDISFSINFSVATSVVKEEHCLSRYGNGHDGDGRDDRNDVPLNVRPLSEMEIANTPEAS